MENGKNRREKFKNSKPHSKKNNLNLRSGVDGTVNNPTYTVASASTVAGSVFMRRLKICFGQCAPTVTGSVFMQRLKLCLGQCAQTPTTSPFT